MMDAIRFSVLEFNRGPSQAPQLVMRTGDRAQALQYARDVARHDRFKTVVRDEKGEFPVEVFQ